MLRENKHRNSSNKAATALRVSTMYLLCNRITKFQSFNKKFLKNWSPLSRETFLPWGHRTRNGRPGAARPARSRSLVGHKTQPPIRREINVFGISD
jgi:hypothetical protein